MGSGLPSVAGGAGRLEWAGLPELVRRGLEGLLGGGVVEAVSQPGGFTPGLASRLVLGDGRRVFVKATGPDPHTYAPEKLRREARIAGLLPPTLPAPRLMGIYDDGSWIAVVFEDVDGTPPAQPWHRDELDRVLAAVAAFGRIADPSPVPAPPLVEDWAADLVGWRLLAGMPVSACPDGIDPWAWRHLDRLAALESGWPDAAAGEALLHGDLRADNILLTPDQVVFVDWASACVGAPWVDLVFLLPSVAMQGGPDAEEVVATHPVTRGVDPDALTAMLASVAGFFVSVGLEPAPPGLPTVRAFQLAQGAAAVRWLRHRLGEEQP
ncbi:MAG TPA: aminoglycoside phosphotransferase family protein [Cryptosporangiaceae bacterium]|nr:aminoglycoside phosphotransferase family protein [Cryptosporangiaceae bacterium]